MATLEEALRRLDGAIGLLEATVTRRLDLERRRADLETELQLMQDDRARLAAELDGTTARLQRVEATADEVGRRVDLAALAIQQVLETADVPEPADRT